ncbi:hypothetical protein WMY93_008155 [Mugilogobius chulae]|uniref:L1 transposable element RRM domain-containing protein n=1 Tax=Mugilogobius chulae TaxID=88201 RepID=A0AAW0PP15_9GOBI
MPKIPKKDEQEKEDSASVSAFTAVLTTKLAETKSELLAEIKDTYAKYEARLVTVQATVDDHAERLDHLERSANATTTEIAEIQATLADVAADNARLKARLLDLEGRNRRNNVRIVGLPESIEDASPTAFFSQLLVEGHRSLAAKPRPTERPRHVLICFHRFQTRELVVRAARRLRGKLNYKGSPIHIFEDYCPEVLEQRNRYREIMRRLYELGFKPALRYPAKLSIVLEDGLSLSP